MPSRNMLTWSAATVAACAMGAAACQGAEPVRPNVILFVTDDTGHEMLGWSGGGANVLTPNLDRLAAGGMVFTRHYATSSVCTPSRYSYLSGRLPCRSTHPGFLRKNEGKPLKIDFSVHFRPGERTAASLFQAAGYRTGMVGKWHAGGAAAPITNVKYLPDEASAFREGDDLADAAVAAKLKAEYDIIRQSIRSLGFDYAEGINWGNTDDRKIRAQRVHNLDDQAKAAVDFLDGAARDGQPFFLHLASSTIHGPHHLASIEGEGNLRITQAGLVDGLGGVLPPRASVRARLAAAGLAVNHRTAGALWLDDLVGAVQARLEALGLADNTIFVFSTDHGPHDGKATCYEGGTHIPACVRWPAGLAAGQATSAFMRNIDWLPTLAGRCGVGIPADYPVDGEDRWSAVTGRADDALGEVYAEMGYARSLRAGKWKYLAFRFPEDLIAAMRDGQAPMAANQMGDCGSGWSYFQALRYPAYFAQDQLYDLEADPGEQRNLAADPAQAAVLADMQARLARHLARFGRPFPLARQVFLDSPEFQALAEKTKADDAPTRNEWYLEDAW